MTPSLNGSQAGPSSSSLHSHTQSLTHNSSAFPVGPRAAGGIQQDSMPRAAGNAARVNSLSLKDGPRKEGLSSDVVSLASSTSQVLVQSVVQRLIKRVSQYLGAKAKDLSCLMASP